MIKREVKMTYKLKQVSFTGTNELCDENGNVVDLMKELLTIFPDGEFDFTAISSEKADLEIGDFTNPEE